MLSTIILAKNEIDTIGRAIKSAKFSDEILVIDDHSTDKTVEIAKKLGCKVYSRELNNDFSASRNFGMEKAAGDWVLFVDADEEVTLELQKEIIEIITSNSGNESYFIKRSDIFWGKKLSHGEVQKAYTQGFIRLMKKGSGTWKNAVHEEFITTANVGQLQYFLNHYAHKSLTQFIRSVNYYSTLRGKELFKEGKRTNILEIMFLPFLKFVYTYIIRAGFLDGPAGFVYSFLMSFHSFLVRAKMYQYEHISQ